MSEQEGVRRATAEVVAALLPACPPGWRVAAAGHRRVGAFAEQDATAELADGTRVPVALPPAARDAFAALRRAHVAAGGPRWGSARVVVAAPDEVSVATDVAEPEFAEATPAPADYRADAADLPDGRPEPAWWAVADDVATGLGRTLVGLGLPADAVRFGGDRRGDGLRGGADEAGLRWRVLRRGGRWLAEAVSGPAAAGGLDRAVFDDPGDAAAFAVGRVVLTGVGPRVEPVHRAEGPFTPRGDDPPLSLFRDLRVLVLGPGAGLDRLGGDHGTVVHPAGTPLPARSLPPELASRPARPLVVRRPVEVLAGTAVPWFGQPGGGTAVVLPATVGELLAAGVLEPGPA